MYKEKYYLKKFESNKMEIKNIIVLGMYPYPWDQKDISDTVRLMTKAFSNIKKVFINPSIGFRRAKEGKYPFKIKWEVKERGDVIVCTPPLELLPFLIIGKLKGHWVLSTLKKLIPDILGADWRKDTVLYLSSAGIAQSFTTMDILKPDWIIFDILDDNIGFPGINENERRSMKAMFGEIIKKATIVTAVSQHLVNSIEENYLTKANFLPNGIDINMFIHKPEYDQPIAELVEYERPLYGFVGALTSWIDFELLLKAASEIQKGTLVLVGPLIENAVPQELLKKLNKHKRVTFLGSKPYDQIPHFLHQFDVLLLPRNYLPHSLASDPLKIYEYLATGKPIVSTAIPSVKRLDDIIYVGETHSDFINNIFLSQKEWSVEKSDYARRRVVDMTWEKRAEKMLELFIANCK